MTRTRTVRAWRRIVPAVALVAAAGGLLAACGGSSSASNAPVSTTKPARASAGAATDAAVAAATPSKKAKMICTEEAQKDLSGVLAMKTTAVTTPTWVDSVYSCTYQYPDGSFTLSVKDLADQAATTAYFASLGASLGRVRETIPLGDGAFATPNGSMVVRKDDKVMLVDVTHLPPALGKQKLAPADVAETVAVTILGCWTG